MPHFLITQVHDEDLSIDQSLLEADTWQVALAMAGLGWTIEHGNVSYEGARADARTNGILLTILLLEPYLTYKNETKIQAKVAV